MLTTRMAAIPNNRNKWERPNFSKSNPCSLLIFRFHSDSDFSYESNILGDIVILTPAQVHLGFNSGHESNA